LICGFWVDNIPLIMGEMGILGIEPQPSTTYLRYVHTYLGTLVSFLRYDIIDTDDIDY